MAFDINGAKQAGYSDQEIQAYLATKQPTAAPAAPTQPSHGSFADLLPLIGAIGGSFIPGLGTIVGGAAGAGLGSLLQQGVKGEPFNPGQALKEAAFGGAGGVVGKGLGFLGSKLIPGLSDAAGNAGESLAVKALRANKSQLTGFTEKHGTDLGKFITDNGLQGKIDPGVIQSEAIKPLQTTFDNIARKSGAQVDPNTLVSNFSKIVDDLKTSPSLEDQRVASEIENEFSSIVNKVGNGPIDIGTLTKFRTIYDGKVGNWLTDPISAGKNRLIANALRQTVQDTADTAGLTGPGGQSLKDIGVQLSKLHSLHDIAATQANLGRGNMPLGLTRLLGLAAGGATGGVGGAAAGFGATSLLNNPEVLAMLSRGATKVGSALSGVPGLPEAGMQSLQRIGIAGGTAAGGESNQNPAIPSPLDMGVPTSSTSPTGQPDQTGNLGMGASSGNPQEDALRKILATVMFSKAKNVSDIKTAYDFLNPSGAAKPLTAQQQIIKANAESGLRALNMVETQIKSDPNVLVKAAIPGSPGARTFETARKEVADVLTRLRTGAALNENEMKFYQSQAPQPFDSPQTIQYKLSIFRDLFNKLANGQVGATPDITIPAPMSFSSQ